MTQLIAITVIFSTAVLLVLIFSYLANRLTSPGTASDPLLDVGGFKFSVHEALMGALTSIIFVLCAAFYVRFIQEANQIRTAQILGAWQFRFGSDVGGNDDKIIAWLMSGKYDPFDIASDYRTELAVSLADRHVVTRTAFLAMDSVVRYGIWATAGLAIIQTLLNARQLRGLRILIPAMVIAILVFIVLYFPECRDLIKLLPSSAPAAYFTGKFP
ncbi:MAG: hypothetical protein WCN98_19405 [Verrucomicrobiaceae bacterium]